MRLIPAILCLVPGFAAADGVPPREGWKVMDTELTHSELLERLLQAVPEEGMGVVTQAGPTAAARERGIDIPENRVVGVFNNDYAVRILALSTPAMIEAPISRHSRASSTGGSRRSPNKLSQANRDAHSRRSPGDLQVRGHGTPAS